MSTGNDSNESMTTSIRAPESATVELSGPADLSVRKAARLRQLFETRLSPAQRRALQAVARASDKSGLRVFLVGGAVRDLLLRRPLRDLDVAVTGDVRILARQLGGPLRGYSAFGTCSVHPSRGVEVDLARTRREHYRRPAALPEVGPAGLADDLARRDFTINALAAPLTSAGLAGLIDPFGGLADLRDRRVRVLHESSFRDDPTRGFRAARVAAELNFVVQTRTARLIRAAGSSGVFEDLSSARLRGALGRTLEATRPGTAVRLLSNWGLLGTLAPELRAPRAIAACLDRLPALLEHHHAEHSHELPSALAIGLAVLFRSSPAAVVTRGLTRLQPSRAVRLAVGEGIQALRELPRKLSGKRRRPSTIHRACRGRSAEALLSVVVATSSSAVRRAVVDYLDRLRDIRPDITGRHLLREGIAPGPAVARGLAAALSAKLDNKRSSLGRQLAAALAAARS